jgi:hypothetical protein
MHLTPSHLRVAHLGYIPVELTKNATDLVNYWSKLTGEAPLGSMRSTPAEQSENARKKARLEDRSLPSREVTLNILIDKANVLDVMVLVFTVPC